MVSFISSNYLVYEHHSLLISLIYSYKNKEKKIVIISFLKISNFFQISIRLDHYGMMIKLKL